MRRPRPFWLWKKNWERPPEHLVTGAEGEACAVAYLQDEGYRILGRNVRIGRHGEIDIVAEDPVDKTIVIVEVKSTRSLNPNFPPELHVHWRKRICLRYAARKYVQRFPEECGYRVDLVCVAGRRVIGHYKEIRLGGGEGGGRGNRGVRGERGYRGEYCNRFFPNR